MLNRRTPAVGNPSGHQVLERMRYTNASTYCAFWSAAACLQQPTVRHVLPSEHELDPLAIELWTLAQLPLCLSTDMLFLQSRTYLHRWTGAATWTEPHARPRVPPLRSPAS
jgi:hypothetical protein